LNTVDALWEEALELVRAFGEKATSRLAMRFWVAGGLEQVVERHGVRSWRA
jgi:hypothetical protein